MFFSEMQLPLKPDHSPQSSSHCRFTQKVISVYTYIKLHIVAFNSQLKDLFSRHHIPEGMKIKDFPHDAVLIALNSVRHKIGIHNGEDILCGDSVRQHGISVHILHGKTFHRLFIAVSRRRDQMASVFCYFFIHFYGFFVLKRRKKDSAFAGKS